MPRPCASLREVSKRPHQFSIMARISHDSPRRSGKVKEAAMTMMDMEAKDRDAMREEQKKEEGRMTRAIERKTSKVPSLTFLGLAVGSMVASAALMAAQKRQLANFIGQWAPTILIMGLYNKVVKIERELMEHQRQTT